MFNMDNAESLRTTAYEASTERLEKGLSEVQAHKTESAPPAKRPRSDGVTNSTASARARDALTLNETKQLLQHFEKRILEICEACKFDRAISATAVIFFKRFYLYAAVTEYHPSAVMCTAIFLAIKTEACPYTEFQPFCDRLQRQERIADADLVGLELPMLMGLKYHLTVYHPYRPLKSLLTEMITTYANITSGIHTTTNSSAAHLDIPVKGPLLKAEDAAFETCWDVIQGRAFRLVDISLTSDLPLLYTTAQIAAACLLLSANSAVTEAKGALSHAPPSEVSWFVPLYLSAKLVAPVSEAASSVIATSPKLTKSATGVTERIARELLSSISAALDADAVMALLDRLASSMNPAFTRGTPEFAARVALRDEERRVYKEEKEGARRLGTTTA